MNFIIHAFIALFIVVDPITLVPIFVAILDQFNSTRKIELIRKAVITAAVALIIFTVAGKRIFELIGIEMYSFRIAGGVLLFIIAIEMLFGRRSRTETSPQEQDDALRRDDVAISPLAIPLMTGPGAITTGIMLFNTAGSMENQVSLIGVILLLFAIVYVVLIKSEWVFKIFGNTGTKIVSRIMGLILCAISVQFIIDGILEVFDLVQ
ncbi:MAG: NAAT family transporter [Methanosarcinales archaeon]|nr:NAAT family transporter [Methanosarcinales archaeon]